MNDRTLHRAKPTPSTQLVTHLPRPYLPRPKIRSEQRRRARHALIVHRLSSRAAELRAPRHRPLMPLGGPLRGRLQCVTDSDVCVAWALVARGRGSGQGRRGQNGRRGRSVVSSPAGASGGGAGGGAGAADLCQRGDRVHDRPGRDRARGPDLLTVVGALLGAQPGESLRLQGWWSSHPQYGRQFEVRLLHHGAAGDDPGHPPLPRLRADQGHRAGVRRADRRALRPGHAADHRGRAGPAGRGAGAGPETHREDHRGVGGAEGDQGGDDLPAGRRGVHLDRGADLQEVRRRLDQRGARTSRTGWPPTCGGSGSRPPTRSRRRSGSRTTARSGSRPGCSTRCRRPPTTATATCPTPQLVADAAKILDVPGRPDHPLPGRPGRRGRRRPRAGARPRTGRSRRSTWCRSTAPSSPWPVRAAAAAAATGRTGWPQFTGVDWDKALAWLKARTGTDLAPEQEQAVRLALTSKVAVLTGGPGCGKSFTVRSIVELAAAKKAKILLVAPTGRAAKRLAELTGHPAATVHRLLKLQPGGDATYDRDNPLDADLLVVDEASMLDLILANKLIKAVPPGAHLLLVGDVDQLPSVGAGEVLRDLLAADTIPRVRLTQVFRQAAESGVVSNAHRINAGRPPILQGMTRLLPVPVRRHRGHRRADRRRRVHPRSRETVRARPAPRRAGPRPDAPRPGRRGRAEHPAAAAAHPGPGGHAGTAGRRPGVPDRRQGHPDPQQLRQGRGRGVQRHRRRRHRPVHRRADPDRAHRRGRTWSTTTSTNSTSWPTRTR